MIATRAPRRVAILTGAAQVEGDGIADHVRLLQAHLELLGIQTHVLARRRGRWTVRAASDAPFAPGSAPAPDAYSRLLVHYNPFMYGRWGFAPWLPALLWSAHRRDPTLGIALMLHEPFVPISDAKSLLMGAWQRAQLAAVAAASASRGASTQAWVRLLSRLPPSVSAIHMPIPSNLPDMSAERDAARRSLGASDATVIVTTFGTDHPSHVSALAVAAQEAIAQATNGDAILLELGSRHRRSELACSSPRRFRPGFLPAGVTGRLLSAGDIFLAPFIDGVSTRRTTVMAALQHGLAVVGTDGPLTDPVLRTFPGALTLTDFAAFAATAARLATDAPARHAQQREARALYAEHYDWGAATQRYRLLLNLA